jgi:hypothetical protein
MKTRFFETKDPDFRNMEKFSDTVSLMFNRNLSSSQVEMYRATVNRYEDIFVDALEEWNSKNERNFGRIPTPRSLKRICERLERVKESRRLGKCECRYCDNSGIVFTVWAGNTRTDMKLIKEPKAYANVRISINSCGCVNGEKRLLRKNDLENREVASALLSGGYCFKCTEADELMRQCLKMFRNQKVA